MAQAAKGQLCEWCFKRLLSHLEEAPDLVAHIRAQVIPAMGGAQGERVDASKEAPLPLRADAMEDTDDLFGRLVDWAAALAAEMGVKPPEAAVGLWDGADQCRGFRAATGPVAAYRLALEVTKWLSGRAESIAYLPSAEAFTTAVIELVRTYRKRYPMAPRPPRRYQPKPCPVCNEAALFVHWPDNTAAGVEVKCEVCHHVVEADWEKIMKEQIE
ncbi:hypothetical protein [Cryobacterium psychrophilum]|uniref:Uncharacterized protein n=2 Tax=Cryobacterium psychrophilum TaxID=41988 RepID=A0A4Y8KQ01_9MICO|nr:hypothetical protein [Cryobacterium psychrophilum]TFD80860.1 hypothetical protein E3T53_04350 [Cryobacterium psychrophilum]